MSFYAYKRANNNLENKTYQNIEQTILIERRKENGRDVEIR